MSQASEKVLDVTYGSDKICGHVTEPCPIPGQILGRSLGRKPWQAMEPQIEYGRPIKTPVSLRFSTTALSPTSWKDDLMKTTLTRTASLAFFVALAALVPLNTSFGATYTWTGANGGATRTWFTGESGGTFSTTNFGTTSFGTGQDLFFPASPSGGAAARTNAINISYEALSLTATNTQAYTINSSSSAVLSIGSGGVTKLGSGALTLNAPLTLTANQTWSGGGSSNIGGSISVGGSMAGSGNMDLYAGNGLTFEQNSNLSNYTGTVNVLNGTLNVNTNTNIGGSIVSAADGVLAFGPSSNVGNQTISGSLTIGGQAEITRNLTTVTATAGITLLDTAVVTMSFGSPGTNHAFATPGNLDWGSAGLQLNLLDSVTGTVANDSTWDFFAFSTYTGTLTSVALATDPASPYAGLNFGQASAGNYFDQKYGPGVWLSDWTTGGQRFIFTESTGVLSVVPEPSTIVFAGIGVVMLGWHSWTRSRRTARVKLIEEHTRQLGKERGLV
jgi:hypothetical protein